MVLECTAGELLTFPVLRFSHPLLRKASRKAESWKFWPTGLAGLLISNFWVDFTLANCPASQQKLRSLSYTRSDTCILQLGIHVPMLKSVTVMPREKHNTKSQLVWTKSAHFECFAPSARVDFNRETSWIQQMKFTPCMLHKCCFKLLLTSTATTKRCTCWIHYVIVSVRVDFKRETLA